MSHDPGTLATRMTSVGFIGSGNIGSTLARLAVDAGHDVVLSNSRGPHTLADLVHALGDRARAGSPGDAATADLVVVTIPLRAYRDVPVAPLSGKVVIDTMNYYPDRDGRIDELDDGSATNSELLDRHLVSAHVVKAFNNIYFRHLASLGRPEGAPDRTALPVAGDDASAKAQVVRFLDDIGYDAVDVGPLAEGARYQPDTPAYAGLYAAGPDEFETAKPAGTDAVRAALGLG